MRTAKTAHHGIVLKSEREIELMRQAGAVVCEVLDRVCSMVAPDVTTADLNAEAERLIAEFECEPLFKGVVNPAARFPFPAALCTSVNEEVVHGVPGERALRTGDVISIDCGVRLHGYCADSARTVPVGEISTDARRLLSATQRALDLAIEQIAPGRMWSEVAGQMEALIESERMSVIRDFVGHGIGREMHEEPKVPNYADRAQRSSDFQLQAGMTLAVEPMVALGRADVKYADADAWAIVTRDGKFAAHYEHSLAVTSDKVIVLTQKDAAKPGC